MTTKYRKKTGHTWLMDSEKKVMGRVGGKPKIPDCKAMEIPYFREQKTETDVSGVYCYVHLCKLEDAGRVVWYG